MIKLPEVSKEELLAAIREGVHDAVRQTIGNIDFYDAVKQGVWGSFPWSDQIMNAITDGVKEAMGRPAVVLPPYDGSAGQEAS